jgi:hypothetical protein
LRAAVAIIIVAGPRSGRRPGILGLKGFGVHMTVSLLNPLVCRAFSSFPCTLGDRCFSAPLAITRLIARRL